MRIMTALKPRTALWTGDRRFDLGDGYYISPLDTQDKAAFLDHFREKIIYDHTINLPFPYTEADADRWVTYREKCTREGAAETAFAVRREDGYLVGAVGTEPIVIGRVHRAELGYWLAVAYWGRGLMTRSVEWFVRYAWQELLLTKLTAIIFRGNDASVRVLEKNNFRLEGLLRRHYYKDQRFIDGLAYGKLRMDP
jgi:RimJ/RimL family protein N-acetyltransferase